LDGLTYATLAEVIHVNLIRHHIESVTSASVACFSHPEATIDKPFGDEDLCSFEDDNIRMVVSVDFSECGENLRRLIVKPSVLRRPRKKVYCLFLLVWTQDTLR